MKWFYVTLLFAIIGKQSFSQNKMDGFYFGIDPKLEVNNQVTSIAGHNTPGEFHRAIYLKIKGDSVFLDTKFADIKGSDTTIYSSDGIYDYFDGTLLRKDASIIEFNLKEVVVNYFEQILKPNKDGFMEVVRRENQFAGKVVAGGILIRDILVRRIPERIKLISETHSYSIIFQLEQK